MHVHPAIAALRAKPDLQRRAQAPLAEAHNAWLTGEAVRAATCDLEQYGSGSSLEQLEVLSDLLTDHSLASRIVSDHAHSLIEALRIEPLGEVPLRHTSSSGFARLQLLERAGAVLSLCVYEPAEHTQEPSATQFPDCDLHELVLSGEAWGQVHRLEGEGSRLTLRTQRQTWRSGDIITCRGLRSTRQFVDVRETVLALQLTRAPESPSPTEEYSLPKGEHIRQVSGDKRASEQLMALGVLGALGDASSLDAMAAFATEPSLDRDARWEAVRQVLAMDSEQGMRLLDQLVEIADDPLAEPAGALLRQLLDTFPILADF